MVSEGKNEDEPNIARIMHQFLPSDTITDFLCKPVMVSEGKNEDEPNIARIMHQCWVQASYCFESYEGLTKLHTCAASINTAFQG